MAEENDPGPIKTAERPRTSRQNGLYRATPTTRSLDDLLDEIDQVLEENAEEFVKNYIQKGGE